MPKKYLAGWIILALVVIFSTLAIYPAATFAGHDYTSVKLLLCMVPALSALSIIYGIAVFASVCFDSSLKAGGAAGVVALLLAIPSLVEYWVEGTKVLSIYYHMGGEPIFQGEPFPWLPLGIMIAAAVGIYFAGRQLFLKRDF